MSSSCQGCGDRQVGCHSNCSRYADYLQKIAQAKAVEHSKNDSTYVTANHDLRVAKYEKWKDKQRKRGRRV